MIHNILTDGMPDTLVVNGVPFEIYTDYRTWIRVGYMLEELSALKGEKQYEKFEEICKFVLRSNPEEYVYGDDFINAIVKFYSGFPKAENDSQKKRKEQSKQNPKPPSYDFVYDSAYIYCSFQSFYHIDLYDIEYMHWWKFLTLFEGLMMSDQTSVNFVIGTRQQKIKSNMPKEEKNRIQKLQKEFALPKSEKEQTLENNVLNNLKKLSGESQKQPQN